MEFLTALGQFVGLVFIGVGFTAGTLAFFRYQDLKRSSPWERDHD